MASDGTTGQIPVASPVQGSQAKTINVQSGSGKSLPPGGKVTASRGISAAPTEPATAPAATKTADPQSLVTQLNKALNDSGRPDQYRVDPDSGGKLIQQVNPATGAVIGEFSAEEFPALARSVGAAGVFIDSLA